MKEVPDLPNPGKEIIVFWPADKAGCGYIRMQVPARSINRLGLANVVIVDPNSFELPLAKIVVLQRNVNIERLSICQRMREEYGTLFVVEEDDNFTSLPEDNPAFDEFHRYSFKHAAAYINSINDNEEAKEKLLKLSGVKRSFYEGLMNLDSEKGFKTPGEAFKGTGRNNFHEIHRHTVGEADLVTVTTQHLYETYSKINPNVVILPNCVDHQEEAYQVNQLDHDGVIIGWAGSLTHLGDIKMVAPALKQIFLSHPNVRIMIGAEFRIFEQILNDLPGCPEFIKKVYDYFGDDNVMTSDVNSTEVSEVVSDCGRFIYRKGTRTVDYPTMWRDVDIALVPGRPKKQFYDSKSNLKGLECSAQHVPIIASDLSEYVHWRPESTGCFIVRKNRHRMWHKYMEIMINDPGLRKDMGERAYEYSLTMDIDLWAPQWIECYNRRYRNLALS